MSKMCVCVFSLSHTHSLSLSLSFSLALFTYETCYCISKNITVKITHLNSHSVFHDGKVTGVCIHMYSHLTVDY